MGGVVATAVVVAFGEIENSLGIVEEVKRAI